MSAFSFAVVDVFSYFMDKSSFGQSPHCPVSCLSVKLMPSFIREKGKSNVRCMYIFLLPHLIEVKTMHCRSVMVHKSLDSRCLKSQHTVDNKDFCIIVVNLAVMGSDSG